MQRPLMSETFDGYHVWLGIPPTEQPVNHYRLLGITVFESDRDVIDHAADRQMAHVRTFQSGRHGALSQRILNELAAARLCLLNAQQKAAYDEKLRAEMPAPAPVAAVPLLKPLPVAQPVKSIPRAAPAKPVARPAPTVAIDDDELDFGSPGGISLSESTFPLGGAKSPTLRIKKRRSGELSWRRSAVLGILAALVVGGFLVTYYVVKDLSSRPDFNWQESVFGKPSAEAPVDDRSTLPPAAPAPVPQTGQEAAN